MGQSLQWKPKKGAPVQLFPVVDLEFNVAPQWGMLSTVTWVIGPLLLLLRLRFYSACPGHIATRAYAKMVAGVFCLGSGVFVLAFAIHGL